MHTRTRYSYESASEAALAPAPPGVPGLPGGGRGGVAGHDAGHGRAHRGRRAPCRDTGHGGHVACPLPDGDGVSVAGIPPERPPGARGGRRLAGGNLPAGARGGGRGGVGHSALRRAGAGRSGVGRGGAGAAARRPGGASGCGGGSRVAPQPGSPVDGTGPVVAGTWRGGRERRGRDAGTGVGLAVGDGAPGARRRAPHRPRGGAVVQRGCAESRGRHAWRHRVCGGGVCAAVGDGAGNWGGSVPSPPSGGVAALRLRRTLLAPARVSGSFGLGAVCCPSAGPRVLWHCGRGGGAA